MKSLNIGMLTATLNSGNMGCNALSYSAICLFETLSKLVGTPFSYSLISDFSSESIPLYSNLEGSNIQVIPPRVTFRSKVKAILLQDAISIKECMEKLNRCDLFFEIAGGDSFSDIYGLKRLQEEYCFHKKVKNKNKPLIFAPQTIGPFKSDQAKKIAADSLSYAKHIFVRDPISYQNANKYADSDKISKTIDMAFFMDFEQRENEKEMLDIGINPSGLLWNGGYTGNNQFGLKCDYKSLLFSIIEFLINEGVDITLVPHVLHGPRNHVEDDYKICLLLKKRYPSCKIAPFFYTPVEAKSFISGLDLLIGSRMHCCIAAYSSGVPIYPLAYSRKFKGLFKEELHYRYCAEMETLNNGPIIDELKEVFYGIGNLKKEMPKRLEVIENYKINLIDDLNKVFLDILH